MINVEMSDGWDNILTIEHEDIERRNAVVFSISELKGLVLNGERLSFILRNKEGSLFIDCGSNYECFKIYKNVKEVWEDYKKEF